ncbi:FG-GAP repeat domain-containing protein [Streptomyces sp. NPDC058667]|uniref:FG-GAP repeat domain-containing protein n=1 Tax=Streptomyces sp. NPDC058667 TaxID=3346588 RepID=UPI00364A1E61
MIHARTPRRRLAASITVALAVTAGALMAGPAVAPAAAEQAQTQQAAPTLPPGSLVIGNGPSGFLSRGSEGSQYVHRWTRYADGVTTTLPAGTYVGSVGSDMIVKSEGAVHKLYDMATGAEPVVIDTGSLGATATFHRLAGSTLVMSTKRAGGADLHLLGKPAGTLVERKVSGLASDATFHWVNMTSPDTVILLYSGTVGGVSGIRVALVDTATATVVEDRAMPRAQTYFDVTVTAGHLAWAERDSSTGALTLAVARRGEPDVTRTPLGSGSEPGSRLVLESAGGEWVTYGVTGAATASGPNPLHSLTARSLKDGRTVKLLDTVHTLRGGARGEQLAQGGTLEHGEGVFRIAPGADGTPAATFVATTGVPLRLDVVEQRVPSTVDFSSGDADMWWTLNRTSRLTSYVELTHTASGKRWASYSDGESRLASATWKGLFRDYTAAYNGAYTWRLTVKATNGISPGVVRTGTLTVASKPHPHDFSDSGSPDLLLRSGGSLLAVDGRRALYFGHYSNPLEKTVIGTGWDAYDQIVTPGNVAGTRYPDVVARDRTGALWLHTGTGKTAFAPRTKISGGWQIYNKLTGGSDLNGDTRPDLVATDKAGDLWLYKGTGSATAPFAPRVKIGNGWGIYNKIVATGNMGGGTAGDLVARDTAGVLWLCLGTGNGTFAPRTRIGGGWDRYAEIVGVGDANRDGRPDVVVNGRSGGTYDSLALYGGTGDWKVPFTGRVGVYTPYDLTRMPFTLF